MTNRSFRIAFWSLIACIAVMLMLTFQVGERTDQPRGLGTVPDHLKPRPRADHRAEIEALENRLACLESRFEAVGGLLDEYDDSFACEARRSKRLTCGLREANARFLESLECANNRMLALENRLKAVRGEIADLSGREPVAVEPDNTLLFLTLPQPIVVSAERNEPETPEPTISTVSVNVEVEAVEVPARPEPAPPRPEEPAPYVPLRVFDGPRCGPACPDCGHVHPWSHLRSISTRPSPLPW